MQALFTVNTYHLLGFSFSLACSFYLEELLSLFHFQSLSIVLSTLGL
jgi:hypothetical protein